MMYSNELSFVRTNSSSLSDIKIDNDNVFDRFREIDRKTELFDKKESKLRT